METVGDDADLREVYDTERQLLYVACTRARDHLLVTSKYCAGFGVRGGYAAVMSAAPSQVQLQFVFPDSSVNLSKAAATLR